ncbi:organic cation transporter 1 [Trichonephila clavipes]|nr:organic cation transporter 1 [Trichonephila clavipes]
MWFIVAERLTQITPPAATPDQLSQRVEAAWSAVPQEHIHSLFESMSRRIPHVAVVCSVIGKFGSTSSFMAIYQQSSELYPTAVRSIGMGITGAVGCVAVVLAPYIVYLANYAKYIPFLVIGLVAVTASMSATLLPETLDEILPQTIQDGETFGKDQRYLMCKW